MTTAAVTLPQIYLSDVNPVDYKDRALYVYTFNQEKESETWCRIEASVLALRTTEWH